MISTNVNKQKVKLSLSTHRESAPQSPLSLCNALLKPVSGHSGCQRVRTGYFHRTSESWCSGTNKKQRLKPLRSHNHHFSLCRFLCLYKTDPPPIFKVILSHRKPRFTFPLPPEIKQSSPVTAVDEDGNIHFQVIMSLLLPACP